MASRWSQLQATPSRWSSLQASSPNTLAPPSSDISQFRQQGNDYGTALKLLRRQARQGDSRSALEAIRVRADAMEKGFSPGGIRRKGEFDAGLMGRAQAMERGAADREQAAGDLRSSAAGDAEPQFTEPGATVTRESRTSAALDLLEGEARQDDTLAQRGLDSATRLGVKDPGRLLRGNQNQTYRKTLDSALGKAATPAEIAALRSRGQTMGVKGEDFDRRANWWERNRSNRPT